MEALGPEVVAKGLLGGAAKRSTSAIPVAHSLYRSQISAQGSLSPGKLPNVTLPRA